MAEFKNPVDMSLRSLYAALGYEKGHPKRNHLTLTIDNYVSDYEARHGPIPPHQKADLQEAQVCAANFLCEEDRGENFWPATSRNGLLWPRDEKTILLWVACIIRLNAFYRYAKKKRMEKAEKDGVVKKMAKPESTRQKRPRSPSPPSEDNSEFEDEAIGVNSEFTLTPWKEPARRFGRKRCIEYLFSIMPQDGDEVLSGFTTEWLNKEDDSWHPAADRRLQLFMHEHNFYFSLHLQVALLRDLITYLRRGTELTHGLEGSQHRELRHRVKKRMEFYTKQFAKDRFLDYESDGTPKASRRFTQMFENREEYWAGRGVDAVLHSLAQKDAPPNKNKKGRKAKAKRLSCPVLFPNLVQDGIQLSQSKMSSIPSPARDATPQSMSANNESRMQLASMAASALAIGCANQHTEDEEESEEDKAHNAVIQDFAAFLSSESPVSPAKQESPKLLMSDFSEENPVQNPQSIIDFIDLCTPQSSRASTPPLQDNDIASLDSPRRRISTLPMHPDQDDESIERTPCSQVKGTRASRADSQDPQIADTNLTLGTTADRGQELVYDELSLVEALVPEQSQSDRGVPTHVNRQRIRREVDSDETHATPEKLRQIDIAMIATTSTNPIPVTSKVCNSSGRPPPAAQASSQASIPVSPKTFSAHRLFPHDSLEAFERQHSKPTAYSKPSTKPAPVTPEAGDHFGSGQSRALSHNATFSITAKSVGSQQPQAHTFSNHPIPRPAQVPTPQPRNLSPPSIDKARQIEDAGFRSPDPRASQHNHNTMQILPSSVNTANIVPGHYQSSFTGIDTSQSTVQIVTPNSTQGSPPTQRTPEDFNTSKHYTQSSNYHSPYVSHFRSLSKDQSTTQSIMQSPVTATISNSPSRDNGVRGTPAVRTITPEARGYSSHRKEEVLHSASSLVSKPAPFQSQYQDLNNMVRPESMGQNVVPATQGSRMLRGSKNPPSHSPPSGSIRPEDYAMPPNFPTVHSSGQKTTPKNTTSTTFVSDYPRLPLYPPLTMSDLHSRAGEAFSNSPVSRNLLSPKAVHASILHSVPKTAHQAAFPSPPQTSSPEPRRNPTTPQLSTPSPAVRSSFPVSDPASRSRTTSPILMPIVDRRPYAMKPDSMPISLQQDISPESRLSRNVHTMAKLSTDMSVVKFSGLDCHSDQSRLTLEFFTQKADQTIDYDRPFLSRMEVSKLMLDAYFERYSDHAGVPLSSLTTLTFHTSVGFKIQHQEFIVKRYGGEKAWSRFKKRLANLLLSETKDSTGELEL